MRRILTEAADDFFKLPAEELIQIDDKTFLIKGWIRNVLEKRKNGSVGKTIKTILRCYRSLYIIISRITEILNAEMIFIAAMQISESFKMFSLKFRPATYATDSTPHACLILLSGRGISILLTWVRKLLVDIGLHALSNCQNINANRR